MATVQQTLSNPLYRNWVKGGLVVKFTRDGLQCFVDDTVKNFQTKCLNDIRTRKGLPLDKVCHLCTIQNVLPCPTNRICKKNVLGQCKYHDHNDPQEKHRLSCPNAICNDLRDKIAKSHRFHEPSWRNTHALLWCSNSWQIAKCFMAADGYSSVSSAEETDFLGLVSVVINLNDGKTIVKDDLSQKNNLFSQARTIRNVIMHTSSFELTDEVLNGYIDTMIRLLNDPVHLASDKHAQSSITKLNQIKTDSMTVTNEDERVIREEALKAIDEKKEEVIQEIEHEGSLQKKNFKDIAEEKTNECIEKLNAERARIQRNEQPAYADAKSAYADAKRDMQTELMNLYNEHYIKVSMFPHRPEEEDTDISKIFVEPHMELVDLQSKLKGDKAGNKIIDSCKDIFYTDSNLCKRIYFTGKAGMGKTTFCKSLIWSWCNAHSKLHTSQACNEEQGLTKNTSDSHTEVTKFIDNGTDTLIGDKHIMLNFAFLFYVSLRHAGRDSEIEDMIKNQLLLQEKHKSFLTEILEKEPEQCLIILDGLDEWSPPKVHHQNLTYVTKELPARSTAVKCSILTTTRPWKLDVLKLRTHEIDKQVDCLGIDNAAADKCISSVIDILNKRRGQSRTPEDFHDELKRRQLNELKTVPLLLKQLVCLWHAEEKLENSKCAIYSKMINHLFELAKTRLEDNPELYKLKEENQNVRISLPKYFDGLQLCQKSLIDSLSSLSFTTLMKKNEESTLVFDSSAVEIHGLSQSEIEICLNVGILSQSKVISDEYTRQKSFSFIHKTFQEFLAAVFVSVRRDSSDENIKTICSKINTVDDVLQQSEFLEFVSGMFPDDLYKLTENICKVASDDAYKYRLSGKEVEPCRLYYSSNWFVYNPIYNISRLMTQCLLESKNNGYEKILIKLEDIFIDRHFTEVLTPVIHANIGNIKSVYIEMDETLGTIPGIIKDIKCLQKFSVCYTRLPRNNDLNESVLAYCADIMKNSKDTLINLSLENLIYSYNFIPIFVNDLIHLTILSIESCTFHHDGMTHLYEFVTRTTQLQEIYLSSINCSDCETESKLCQESSLDLSNHQQLKILILGRLDHVPTVTINTSKLQRCEIDTKYVKCLQCGAPNLEDLRCLELNCRYSDSDSDTQVHSLVITLPTLIQLKTVDIVDIDFGDRELVLSPEMKNLEYVDISCCTMTSRAVSRFVDSIPHTQHSVVVNCLSLTIKQAFDGNQWLEYIKSCSRFKVTNCEMKDVLSNKFSWFKFHTVPIGSE